MKNLLKYLCISLIFVTGFNFNAHSEQTTITDMLVKGKARYGSKKGFTFKSPDKNFKKLLKWRSSYGQKIETYDKQSGTPCFKFVKAVTFDGKKIALVFKYSRGGSSQTNTCVPELYKISSTQSESILATAGFDTNGKIDSDLYYDDMFISVDEF